MFEIYKNKEALAEALAEWIINLIESTLQNQEYFTLVLSGGETPKILYTKLASAKYRDKINWDRIYFFWGDERMVPFDDERNNAKMAFDLLIDHVEIPSSQVHIIRTDIEPIFAAQEYEKMLHTFFDNTSTTFDLVLLGMGDDGHTLSLFPGSAIMENQEIWVCEVYKPDQQMYRITLMPTLINRSSNIAFMVDGAKKAAMLKEVIEGKYDPKKFPAQIIKPVNGKLYWFLDEAAAKELKK